MSINYNPTTKIIERIDPTFKIDCNPLGYQYFVCLKKNGDAVAQIEAETGVKDTYKNLLNRCISTAIHMKKLGIKPGDVISICSYNHLNCAVAFIAAQFIGAITANLDPTIASEDIKHLLSLVDAKLLFISDNCENWIDDVTIGFKDLKVITFGNSKRFKLFNDFLGENGDDENFTPYVVDDCKKTAVIFFSSGTTGLAKAICLSHEYVWQNCILLCSLEFKVFVSYASLYWISTLLVLSSSIYKGFARIICKTYDEYDFWKFVDKYKIDSTFLAPMQAIKAIKVKPATKTFDYLKFMMIGGSTISSSYMDRIRSELPKSCVMIGYGLTEIGIATCFYTTDELLLKKLYSCGLPIPYLKVKVVDFNTEEPLGPNKEGEIRIKASHVMNGYCKRDSSDCFDKEGFFKTGDIGYYDEDFCFYITDRIKEMFKYLSWHIVPAKLESILESHPDVKHAIVVGIPHPEDDNHATGVVVLHEGAKISASELEKFFNNKVDDRNRLHGGIKFTDQLPLTPTGKIMRREVRDMVVKKVIL